MKDGFCFICTDDAKLSTSDGTIDCVGCGKFYRGTSEEFTDKKTEIKLSGWIREQNRNNITPTINDEVIKRIAATPMPTIMQRADYLLLEISKDLIFITHTFQLNAKSLCKLYRASYSTYNLPKVETYEVDYLIDTILVPEDYIQKVDGGLHILPKGHIRIEELRKQRIGKNAFVAMWFDDTMNDAYEQGIEKGIKAAGYEAVRIDKKHHNNKIIDEIMVEIKSSAFVVADLTEHNKGVYFEAGYALGLGLPVIWTCKDTDLENLHFDIRQYNCVTWKENELGDFAENLKYRIINTLGDKSL